MTAVKLKLKIEQGATFRKRWRWRSGGVIVDLTGYTARMQIRPDVDSDMVLADLTTQNGKLFIENKEWFGIDLNPEFTAGLNFEDAVYDYELVAPNGDVWRMLQGISTVSREVTRNDN